LSNYPLNGQSKEIMKISNTLGYEKYEVYFVYADITVWQLHTLEY